MHWRRYALLVLSALTLFALFVWPTPWKVEVFYSGNTSILMRTNRVTGTLQFRVNGYWAYYLRDTKK